MLAAPGAGILTTKMGGGYWAVEGTSASAPLVTGVVGLIKSIGPSLNPHNVVKALKDGARKVASLSGKVTTGGVVSASGALEQLHGSGNQSPPLPPPARGSGGTGPGGSFNTTPPPLNTGAPGPNLPNLDQARNAKPEPPKTRAPIQSNLMCADCDPQGGGGGAGYYPSGDPNFSTARRRPTNETGNSGVDLGSTNFNWSAPLLNLGGRAGLDLGLTLAYNSLVWTKDGSYVKYNADLGTPAPGFRLGLPTLQQRFLNSQTGIYAYMMVTPSGGRVELRQVGSSNIYEAQDGSYAQLDATNSNAFLVRTTDGTQLTFAPVTIKDPKGAVQVMTYDAAGRTDRITNQTNNAYTRYVYNPYGDIVTWSTIQDAAGEAFAVTYFDGAGRLRSTASDLPNSTGGFRGQFTAYDVMGRVLNKTNPAEMNGSWVPVAEDAAGWVLTSQTYDWKGRPLVTTNPDGSTRESVYGGCGCAGGEVTTLRDERGRRRKLTMDVLGRLKQVDELNWDQTVYATTSYVYNARDQITQINQAGQIRSFAYDGFGRLQSRTTPEQGAMTYNYFADDTTQTVTDARGATTTFAYNNRHLPTSITYGVPAGVAATSNVSFGYDAAGNRTSMTDGSGSVSYSFNTLSQLTSETRSFTGVGSFSLSYSYNLSGELTSITNPWSAQVAYNYDKVGRPTSVTGANYGGVSSYVSNITYRAFGGSKQISYNDGRTLSLQYDNRMRVSRWDMPGVMGWSYSYNNFSENTGRVTYAQNLYDPTLDRAYDYDNVGRLIEAHTGSEARGQLIGQGGTQDGPYAHSYRYDQMGNMWYRVGWGGWFNPWLEQWPSYTNNRLTTNPWTGATMQYDASGNLANDGYQSYTYDATGQQTYASATGLSQSYDGDRLRVAKTESGVTTYYLRSTLLGGQVVSEINSSGVLQRGYVYLGGQMLAIQQSNQVSWVHQDPVTKSQRVTNSSGTVTSTIDLDPWGGETSRSSNAAFQPHKYTTYERDANGGDEAMMRRFTGKWHRFDQPDPYDGSYDLTNPQSFNRYAYTQNDPVNFVDPAGLQEQHPPGGWPTDPSAYGHLETWTWAPFYPGGSPGQGRHGMLLDTGDPIPREPQNPIDRIITDAKKKAGGPLSPFEKARAACMSRELAKANAARAQYVANFPKRILRGATFGAVRGGAMGAYAGFNGGEFLEPLGGGLPGAAGGALVGGILGAGAGVISSMLTEPAFRWNYDRSTYRPAVDRTAIDCDAEARTATSNAMITGGH